MRVCSARKIISRKALMFQVSFVIRTNESLYEYVVYSTLRGQNLDAHASRLSHRQMSENFTDNNALYGRWIKIARCSTEVHRSALLCRQRRAYNMSCAFTFRTSQRGEREDTTRLCQFQAPSPTQSSGIIDSCSRELFF